MTGGFARRSGRPSPTRANRSFPSHSFMLGRPKSDWLRRVWLTTTAQNRVIPARVVPFCVVHCQFPLLLVGSHLISPRVPSIQPASPLPPLACPSINLLGLADNNGSLSASASAEATGTKNAAAAPRGQPKGRWPLSAHSSTGQPPQDRVELIFVTLCRAIGTRHA